jgi:hypothetical protein
MHNVQDWRFLYSFFCVVLSCVFTFWVPCCDVRYDFIQIYPGSEGYLRKIPDERRGKFHEPLKRRGKFSSSRNRYFSQITFTNRIYLFNFAEYLTASKTVACKHHCRLEPRHLSVFFFTIQISSIKFKITADTVVCHFSFLYRWLEEETRVIRKLHTWRHKLFKEGIFSRALYLPSTVANTTLYVISKDKYPSDGEKHLVKNTPFINQSEDSIHI